MVEVHERLVWGFNFLGMGIYGYFCFFRSMALIHSFDSRTGLHTETIVPLSRPPYHSLADTFTDSTRVGNL